MGAKYDFGRNWHDERVIQFMGAVIRDVCREHFALLEDYKKARKPSVKKHILAKLKHNDSFFDSQLYKLICPLDKEDMLNTYEKRLVKKVSGKGRHTYGFTNSLRGYK